ncbi:hypothetical protein COU80_01950 [Candidatus Peregrinibacteria bacterium CG10_big_fil_rev_8_21_14_0_10_55_24]|nr:MAG: hypothetical protein COU80_01950 [Candidatus Peregrinibacteria bacterium CG10_big_fil_rev_8_21_14_0_10_55_24]
MPYNALLMEHVDIQCERFSADPSVEDLQTIEHSLCEGELADNALLLTHLGKEYKRNDNVQNVVGHLCEHPLLSQEEEFDIAQRAADANDPLEAVRARHTLVLCNQRLIVYWAKRYRNMGLDYLDLIQEGNVGLLTAADKFDYQRGYKFATYASWWIRQAMLRALTDTSRTIRLPAYVVDRLSTLRSCELRLMAQSPHKPSLIALSQELGWSVEAIEALRKARKNPCSLDAPLHDGETSFGNLLVAPQTSSHVEVVSRETRELIERVLRSAPGVKPFTVESYLWHAGLKDGRQRTAAEVALILGKSTERARQHIDVAKRILKQSHALRALHNGNVSATPGSA